MQVIRNFVVALVALTSAAFVPMAEAQIQQARGKATVAYAGSKATPADKAKAVTAAQLKAVETYYAEAGESEAANFDTQRAKIAENPDRYFLDTTVLSEDDNAGNKSYTVAVRVSLNVANLRNDFKSSTAVGKAGRNERSALAFLFVSREVDSQTSYDPRISKRVDTTDRADAALASTDKGRQSEKIRGGSVQIDDARTQTGSASLNRSSTIEIGGKTTRRSSEATYRLFPSANLNQVFTQTFTRAGFKVNEAALVEPYTGGRFRVSQVEDDYKVGNDLKPATMQSIAAGMKNAQIPFMALGTLDVGLADRDPATGMMRVSVSVNARVFDLSSAIPDTIASVGPVQYAGVGPSEDEARTAALKLAANNAARELSSQLNNLGVGGK